MKKKKKTIVLLDGENISAKNAESIVAISNRLGSVLERKVYHHQKDQGTRAWTEKTKNGDYKDIMLCGEHAKDKVDRKIQKDARRYLNDPDVDKVCVVTSDGGFSCLVKDEAVTKKRLCFIGGKNPSLLLQNAGVQSVKL